MAQYVARLKVNYTKEVLPQLVKEFKLGNVQEAPKMVKIVLNMGLGAASKESKILDSALKEMEAISGQKPVITKAKKSIASFQLREGMSIGCMVTLRGNRMYEFYDRLVSIALPQVRDFRGLSPKGFDGRGNYTLGIREQIIFPEIHYDKIDRIKGMNITIVTNAKNDEHARHLLKLMGMPFRSQN